MLLKFRAAQYWQRSRSWCATLKMSQRRWIPLKPGLPEIQVIRDLFEGLVNQNEKGEIVPGVATQWKSNDNRIWTFTLRDNAKWADGTPVTAQDFVYSWQRLVDPKTLSPFAWFAALAESTTHRRLLMVKPRLTSLALPQLMPIL